MLKKSKLILGLVSLLSLSSPANSTVLYNEYFNNGLPKVRESDLENVCEFLSLEKLDSLYVISNRKGDFITHPKNPIRIYVSDSYESAKELVKEPNYVRKIERDKDCN